MRYLVYILFLLSFQAVSPSSHARATKAVAGQKQKAHTIRKIAVFSSLSASEGREEIVNRYHKHPASSLTRKQHFSKSFGVTFSEPAFYKSYPARYTQGQRLSSGIPFGRLLLFPNHYFW